MNELPALLFLVSLVQTYPVSSITPEEWIITMLSFFMMGSQARIGSLARTC